MSGPLREVLSFADIVKACTLEEPEDREYTETLLPYIDPVTGEQRVNTILEEPDEARSSNQAKRRARLAWRAQHDVNAFAELREIVTEALFYESSKPLPREYALWIVWALWKAKSPIPHKPRDRDLERQKKRFGVMLGHYRGLPDGSDEKDRIDERAEEVESRFYPAGKASDLPVAFLFAEEILRDDLGFQAADPAARERIIRKTARQFIGWAKTKKGDRGDPLVLALSDTSSLPPD